MLTTAPSLAMETFLDRVRIKINKKQKPLDGYQYVLKTRLLLILDWLV